MKTNLESVREIYSVIENLGSTKDRKHIKIFYNHVKQWKVKNNYSSVLIPVKKKTVFINKDTKLDFEGSHKIELWSFLESIKWSVSRGLMGNILYACDVLDIIPEKVKKRNSLVLNETVICLKEFIAFSFMCYLHSCGIEEFDTIKHGEKLCDFLNELRIIE